MSTGSRLAPTTTDRLGKPMPTGSLARVPPPATAAVLMLPTAASAESGHDHTAPSRVAAAASREDVWKNFARFGYALIPLHLAAHLAHNLFHLLAEGKAVVVTVGSLVGIGSGGGTNAIVGNGTIQVLQDALVALGLGVGVRRPQDRGTAPRRHGGSARARTVARPYVTMVLLFAAVNAVLLALPMVHRV